MLVNKRYEYEESMDKPTIFFSHSSIDRDYITELQNGVNNRTSGTINIFQSSDGESIPFGNNWVHKIEENLHKAKIMFVFISPKSLSSSWIYFESGFAYAKNVKVIPIGIKGVDIGKLRPPLNLLQGFNIISEAGMNNIISILNSEFSCNFSDSFDSNDFKKLSLFDESSLLDNTEVFENINRVTFEFPVMIVDKGATDAIKLADKAINIFQQKLNDLGVQSAFSGINKLHAHGLIVSTNNDSNNLVGLSVTIDPYMLKTYEEIISNIFAGMYEKNILSVGWFSIFFEDEVSLETTDFKVSSKLSQAGIKLLAANGSYFNFNALNFTIEPKEVSKYKHDKDLKNENLRVVYDLGAFCVNDLAELLRTLARTKVIA
jgi:hypothetical protein